jgi:hypothetical protein
MTLNRPDFGIQFAFSADPSDPNGIPVWQDWTKNIVASGQIARGIQYEQARPVASAPTFSVRDINEILNPANPTPGVPYAGLVLPYRRELFQGIYPLNVGGSPSTVVPQGVGPTLSEQGTAGTTSFTVFFPASVTAGHYLYLAVVSGGGVTTTPAGWTPITAANQPGADSLYTFGKFANGTEGGTSIVVTVGSAGRATAFMRAFSGVDTTNPINTTLTGTRGAVAGSTVTTGSGSTSIDKCYPVSVACGNAATSLTWTQPGGFTLLSTSSSGAGAAAGKGAAYAEASAITPAGGVGPYTWTWSQSNLAMDCMVAFLQPQQPPGGNFLNAGMWVGNNQSAYDPSFESYAAGAHPSWITGLGGTNPTVTTTNPHGGTKCITTAMAAMQGIQGYQLSIPTMPGRQYTLSAWLRQTAANSVALAVQGLDFGVDGFNRTVAPGGWGSADTVGGAYTTVGTAGDFKVVPGAGVIAPTTLNSDRIASLLPTGAADFVASVVITPNQISTGAAMIGGLVARWNSGVNSMWRGELVFNTDQTVTLRVIQRVTGVEAILNTTTLAQKYKPGVPYVLIISCNNQDCRVTAYQQANPFLVSSTSGLSSSLSSLTIGAAGCYALASTGNTNSAPSLSYSNLNISSGAYSASANTTGGYFRLSRTFTATQPSHTVQILVVGTSIVDTAFNVDEIQLESGAVATAFTTTGPVLYPIHAGLTERWPRSWDSQGFEGYGAPVAIDRLAALTKIDLESEWQMALTNLAPDYSWRLGDGSTTTAFPETSGNGGPPLRAVVSKYGAGTAPSAGGSIGIPGEANASGVSFAWDGTGTGTTQKATILGTGLGPAFGGTVQAKLPLTGDTANFKISVSVWFQTNVNALPAGTEIYLAEFFNPGSLFDSIAIGLKDSLGAFCYVDGTLARAAAGGSGAVSYADQKPHLLTGVVSMVAGTATVFCYVDGVQIGTASTPIGAVFGCTAINVGGDFRTPVPFTSAFKAAGVFSGTLFNVAAWDRALTGAEVAALYQAGGVGFAGETTGARITRHLALGQYVGNARISPGRTTMQAPTYGSSIDLLSDSLNTTQAEQGNFWLAPDDAVVFEGRDDQWLRTTPRAVLGENQAAGEIPYQQGILFDFDPTFVYSQTPVQRNGGAQTTGGLSADIQAAVRRYLGSVAPPISADFLTDAQAQDLANWQFYTHNAPLQRVAAMAFDPSADPTLWAFCLSVEIGWRVTVKRRAKAANSGAGITMSSDYFVTYVAHDMIDASRATWVTTLMLQPVGLGTPQSDQPWILEDTTYGVLGTTTKAGW